MQTWDHRQPIYQQLAELLAGRLLRGDPPEGELMPSVRNLASHYLLNPLTVNKALQVLATLDEGGVLENRRGVGLYVMPGARERLRQQARERFLTLEWPRLRERLQSLGLKPEHLEWEENGCH